MKILIVLLLLSFSLSAEEENPLQELSAKMKEVELMLRDDRHDAFVQIKQKNISINLDKMIADAEKSQQQKQQNQEKEKSQKQQRQEQRQQMMAGMPKQNSQPGPATPPGPTQEHAQVAGTASKWAKLPQSARDELLQTYAGEVPPRWRQRLEAYFLSIAAEEVKDKR